MVTTHLPANHLRFDRASLDALGRALAISVLLHLLGYGAYRAELRYHWMEKIPRPNWFHKAERALVVLPPAKVRPPVPAEQQMTFVEVNPAETAAAPKHAKYYSNKSSVAANRDADADANAPKIDGTQTHVVKTESVPRTQTAPAQAAAPPTPEQKQAQPEPEAQPRKSMTPGNLAMAKPQPQLRVADGQAEALQPRPRTIVEALARQQAHLMPGQQMKEEGGIKHRAIVPSFDVIGSKFGEYDAAIIAAIQSRWYSLLDAQQLSRGTGKVTVEFHLNDDGTVSEMEMLDNSVGELLGLLCERAIRDPAPFARWPDDMRRMVGATYRDVKFTFFYD